MTNEELRAVLDAGPVGCIGQPTPENPLGPVPLYAIDPDDIRRLLAIAEAAEKMQTALRVAQGTIIEFMPCADPECQQTQIEWKHDCIESMDKALAGYRAAREG